MIPPTVRTTIDQKIPFGLVVNDSAAAGIEEDSVSDVIAIEVKILTEEEPHLPLLVLEVGHLDLFDIDIQVEVNRVTAAKLQP
jgi:hypothetical protein